MVEWLNILCSLGIALSITTVSCRISHLLGGLMKDYLSLLTATIIVLYTNLQAGDGAKRKLPVTERDVFSLGDVYSQTDFWLVG